jgi:hypothetical protein
MQRLMALILCAALMCNASVSLAQEEANFSSNGFQFVIAEDGTAKIIGFAGEVQEVTFPSRLNGYDVTAIGEDVLRESNWARSIVIPASIVSISSKAFSNAYGVESIFVLPGNQAYESIGGVLYDKTEKCLQAYPKGRWSDRYSVQQGTCEIGADAFCGCNSLKTIELPESLKGIGDSAFAGCYFLSEINLPECLYSIGTEAFYGCGSLKEITLPAGLSSIGPKAFADCPSLKEFRMESTNPLYSLTDGVLYAQNGKQLLHYPGSKKGTRFAIPEGTEAISEEAFAGNRYLKTVVIPKSVKSIGTAAFTGCAGLAEIVVAEGNVAYHAEDGVLFDTLLKRLEAYPAGRNKAAYEIPEGTKVIGVKAFANCLLLTGITIPQSVTSLGEAAFSSCEGLTAVTLPGQIKKISSQAFAYCYMMESATLCSGIEEIGDQAFYFCGLTGITLPEGLTCIGESAFGYCMDLMGVYIPGSVKRIAKDAFDDSYYAVLEVDIGSYGQIFANENKLGYTLHPVWLK